jgi:hypothetical protein
LFGHTVKKPLADLMTEAKILQGAVYSFRNMNKKEDVNKRKSRSHLQAKNGTLKKKVRTL